MTAALPATVAALQPQRRRLLLGGASALAGAVAAAPCRSAGHDDPGIVRPPRAIPHLPLTLDDGARSTLGTLLAGRTTALQFVLTGCSATCPLLGAIFAGTQQRLAASGQQRVQLLSLSVDPLGDTPQSLRGWLNRFGASAGWRAALPRPSDADEVAALTALAVPGGAGGGSAVDSDRHAAGVLLIDRQARLVYRTGALPDSALLSRLLLTIAGADGA